jgi:DNA/RNA endonuclease YhcR with UshA esterase domain
MSPTDDFGITNGVKSVAVHAGSTLAVLDPHKAKGLVYLPALTSSDKWPSAVDQGVYFGGGVQEGPIAAIAKIGKGKAAFIGDSSPVEDATPKYLREENGTKKVTYDGFKEADDGTFLTNVVNWLSKQENYTEFDDTGIPLDQKSPLLDSETPSKSTEPQPEPWAPPAAGYKWYDPNTFAAGSYGSTKSTNASPTYSFVHQATLPNAEEFKIRVSLDHLAPGQTVTGLKAGIYLAGGTQVGLFQNDDGSWPSNYGYSADFSVTANALGHASKDLTVKMKPATEGAASLRLKNSQGNLITESVQVGNVPSEPLPQDPGNLPDLTTIIDARKQKEGSLVTVQGVVTSVPGAFGGNGFYLQDNSAGIYVFQNQAGFKPGDQIKVTAPLSVYNSELELSNPVDIQKTGTADVPKANTVTEISQDNQGQLVRLEKMTIANLMSLSNAFEFDAVRDGKSTHVRVDGRTGLSYDQFSQQFKNGDVVNITGISSIFKDAFQLKPLSLDDFEKVDTVPPLIQDLGQTTFYFTDAIKQEVQVTDEGTGVDDVRLVLDGNNISNPLTVDPLQLSIGQHMLVVEAKDRAGNESSRTFALQLVMDADHLDELLSIGYNHGDITNHGVYNSLMYKAEGIQKSRSKLGRKLLTAAMALEVKALSGSKISKLFAGTLLNTLKQLN